ncbi:MAG: hypothetical protein ACOYJD_04890 [Christensenellales bacterium]
MGKVSAKESPKKTAKKNKAGNWAIKITLFTFIISGAFSLLSESVINSASLAISIIIVFFIMLIGIVADIIGMAIVAADEKTFIAMAAKKIKGATRALKILRQAEKVTNICNDVIGDICSIVSGASGAVIAVGLIKGDSMLAGILISSIISALTVGGKAIGKNIALKYSEEILHITGRVMDVFARS